MLPPEIAVVGSAVSEALIWLSYTTALPWSLSQILIRNLSTPPPPDWLPSIAVRMKPKLPVPLIVPVPLYWP